MKGCVSFCGMGLFLSASGCLAQFIMTGDLRWLAMACLVGFMGFVLARFFA